MPPPLLEEQNEAHLRQSVPVHAEAQSTVQTFPAAPVLSKKDAMTIQVIADAERGFSSSDEIYPASIVRSYAPSSFRWVFRYTSTEMRMPLIEGDVSSVYPGITKQDLQRNCNLVSKFFTQEMMREVTQFMQLTLEGKQTAKKVFTWHSKAPYEFSVNIRFYQSYRYLDSDTNQIVCIQLGETHDVSAAMREHEQLVAHAIARHRESYTRRRDSIDHRFGNKLRLMHLLASRSLANTTSNDADDDLQNTAHSKPVDDDSRQRKSDAIKLLQCFENLSHEIAIRRGHFESLPTIEPVRYRDFIEAEFITIELAFGIDPELEFDTYADRQNPRLTFFDKQDQPVSPLVLQCLFFQDLASNAFKHGMGSVEVRIGPFYISFANRMKAQNRQSSVACSGTNRDEASYTSKPCRSSSLDSSSTVDSAMSESDSRTSPGGDTWCRNKVGLLTLRRIAQRIHLDLEFDDTSRAGYFISTLYFSAIKTQPEVLSPPSSPQLIADNSEEVSSAQYVKDRGPRYAWCLLEDESLICALFQKVMKHKFNITVDVIQHPSDVGNLVRKLFDLYRQKKKSIAKFAGFILIMDEHLVELTDECTLRPVSGSTLRDRIFAHSATEALLDLERNPDGMHLFSSSASQCEDKRVLLHLGKTGSVARDAPRVLRAVEAHRSAVAASTAAVNSK